MAKKKKKPYFPNNWREYKDSPDDMFIDHTFEEFMDWKVGGWQLPSSVACIIRVTNLNTKKVKEYVYSNPRSAVKFIDNLMESDEHEFTIVDEETVHVLHPKSHGN